MLQVRFFMAPTQTVLKSLTQPPTFRCMTWRKTYCCFRRFSVRTQYMRPIPYFLQMGVRYISVQPVPSPSTA